MIVRESCCNRPERFHDRIYRDKERIKETKRNGEKKYLPTTVVICYNNDLFFLLCDINNEFKARRASIAIFFEREFVAE